MIFNLNPPINGKFRIYGLKVYFQALNDKAFLFTCSKTKTSKMSIKTASYNLKPHRKITYQYQITPKTIKDH